jgi:hypothetical protein
MDEQLLSKVIWGAKFESLIGVAKGTNEQWINTVKYCCASVFVISLHLSYSVRLNRIEYCFLEKKRP